MRGPRLIWQLYFSYLIISLAVVAAVAWVSAHAVRQVFLQSVQNELRVAAAIVEQELDDDFPQRVAPRVEEICRMLDRAAEMRVTLVAADGRVLIDTREDPAMMDNHQDRREVRGALAGEATAVDRYSQTTQQAMTYVALPVRHRGETVAVLRTAMLQAKVGQAVRGVLRTILATSLSVGGLAAIAGLWFAWRISQPLEEVRRGAERFAEGDLGYQLPAPQTAEAAGVVQSLNRMADQLKEKILATMRQNTEQEAVLASMVEGVLAVDSEERIISLNQAAAELLGTNQVDAPGRALAEVVRNAELRRFVLGALNCRIPVEGDVVLGTGLDRVLQAHGTALRDAQGQPMGAVIVLNDITRLRKLENLRRDFVANVSHELKTPITSIKGFVETLLDGALENREDAERFLRIIARQADRLNAIIEDLLSLSKIEQGEESGAIVLVPAALRPILLDARAEMEPRAAEKQIEIAVDCPDDLQAPVNSQLLQQALLNLLDNAVKYSGAGSRVEVSARQTASQVIIDVKDNGCGIEAQHLPRLFERFYRVDKGRSRKLGGTGLGLAIVKHIVQAHHGRIDVQSQPGQGSVFSITLERAIALEPEAAR